MKISKDFASFRELYPDVAAQLPPGLKLQVSKSTFAQIAKKKQSELMSNQKAARIRFYAQRIAHGRIKPVAAITKTVREKKSADLCNAIAVDTVT